MYSGKLFYDLLGPIYRHVVILSSSFVIIKRVNLDGQESQSPLDY